MKKGYIGPIGDDFPAMFPILLGLMLFFGAVTVTYNVYEAKNSRVNAMRANIMISRAIRERKHMDHDYWKDYACPLLKTSRSNYGIHAAMRIDRTNYTTYDTSTPNYVFESKNFSFDPSDATTEAVCYEGGTTFDDWGKYVPVQEFMDGRDFVSMKYPIVVDVDDGGTKRALTAELEVITWT
ncbi:hypothetical protein K8R43_04010 [archaeon]|nr:hypothetical protein [archaeon]